MTTPARSAPRPWTLLLLILIGGVAIRCVGITQPFTDTWSWRQGDVAMIAHNFYHNGFHLFYPEINWGGPPTASTRGYVGTELPIMPWTAALLYTVVGEHEWVGRMLSVLTWAASLPAFFIYLRRLINDRTALFACVLYTLMPLSVYTARSFMPDMPSLAAAFWALALFDYWLDKRGNWWLILGTVAAIALAVLVKPPSIMIGFPMVVRALQKGGVKVFADWRLWLIAIVSVIPAYFWFKHAAWLGKTYFPHHFFGAEGLQQESAAFYLDKLEKMVGLGLTPVAVLAGVAGMVLALRDRRLWPFYAWVAGWAVFFVVAGHGNRHPWYQLPLAPPLAVFGAVLLVWLYVNIRPAHLVLGATACFTVLAAVLVTAYVPVIVGEKPKAGEADQRHYLSGGLYIYGQDAGEQAMLAGEAVDRLTPKDAVIIAANAGDPVVFYYAHRYGWLIPREKDTGLGTGMPESYHGESPTDWVTNEALIREIEQRRRDGAQFLIATGYATWWLDYYTGVAAYMRQFKVTVGKTQSEGKTEEVYRLYDLRGP